MSQEELARSIHDLIGAELASTDFYTTLANTADDQQVVGFFKEMARAEASHAEALETLAEKLPGELSSLQGGGTLATAELVPLWESADGLTLAEAMDLAMEAEQHAQMIFEALAETNGGMVARLFAKLAAAEESHLRQLGEVRQQLGH